MIIYLNEENSYRSWVTHHREGFVIDWLRKPNRRKPILHRASCQIVRSSRTKKTHWTTGRNLKACSLNLDELLAWARTESGHEPRFCEGCLAIEEPPQTAESNEGPVTRLGAEILDAILEVAIIHLDNQDSNYKLNVGDVADGLGKTTGQIAAALERLVHIGYLSLSADNRRVGGESVVGGQRVFPTVKAIRTLPAFEQLSDPEIERELAILDQEPD